MSKLIAFKGTLNEQVYNTSTNQITWTHKPHLSVDVIKGRIKQNKTWVKMKDNEFNK